MRVEIIRTREGKIRVIIPQGLVRDEKEKGIRVSASKEIEFDEKVFEYLKKLIEYAKKQGLI